MFQSLRPHNQFFILHKEDRPYLEIGKVIDVTPPIARYPVPQTFGKPQELMVDVIVDVNGYTNTFQKLPANQDISDFGTRGNIIVATSRDAMNSEVATLRQKRIDTINNIDKYKEEVDGYDVVLQQLNPEYAEKQRQQLEIDSLKDQMASMSQSITDLVAMNKELMSKLSGNSKKSE